MLMQNLAFAVVVIVGLCALRWFKATVLVWMVAQTLFNAQIAVRYDSPAMSCLLATDMMLLAIYFCKYRNNNRIGLSRDAFLFHVPMIAMMSSYLISSLFAVSNSMTGFTATIKFFVANFGMLYLFQKCLNDLQDVKLFFKAAVIVVLLQTTLALSEAILHDNLWLDFVFFNSPQNETTYGRMFYIPPQLGGSLEIRYGMVRCRSFFGIHIAFGFFCLMYLYLLMTVYIKRWKVFNKIILLLSASLLFAGIMMGNSKTSYVGLIILLFSLYKPEQVINVKVVGPLLILIIGVLMYFPEYMNNIISLFDKSLAEEGGGSTVAGREVQFRAAFQMFEMNPLFGNGVGSIGLLKEHGFEDILGAESSWMQILPERGLYGVFAYLIMYINIYKTFKPTLGRRTIFFFLLSIFVMETATGILDMVVWGTVLLVAYRLYQLRQRSVVIK